MELSGTETAVSEATSLMAGLIVGKTDDNKSIADSMLGTGSAISEATSTGVSKSSQVTLLSYCYELARECAMQQLHTCTSMLYHLCQHSRRSAEKASLLYVCIMVHIIPQALNLSVGQLHRGFCMTVLHYACLLILTFTDPDHSC